MISMRTLLLIFLAASSLAPAQSLYSGVDNRSTDPSGACTYQAGPTYFGRLQYNVTNGNLWGCQGGTWTLVTSAGGGGGGTVTSVGLSTNLGTVTGSPVTTSGTLTNTVSAAQVVSLFSTCSGVQYLGADGACHNYSPGSGTVTSIATTSPITGGTITTTGTIACATCVTSAAALTSNLPVFGAGSQASAVGTRSGNTTEVATAVGSFTAGNCPQGDANGNLVDSGIPCTGGGGGGTGGNIITGNWTTLGSTATRTDHTNSITILGTTSATNRVDGVCHTVSAGDFSYVLVFLVSLPVGATGPPAILAGFTDGTKTEGAGAGADTAPFITGQNLKNTAISGGTVSAANGTVAGADHNASSNPVYVTLTRTGTALAGSVSHNSGVTYDAIFNDTTPFLTASSICVYIVSRGSVVIEQFTLVTSSLP